MNDNIKEIALIVIKELDQSTDGAFYTEEIATALYNAGYRKQSDTVKEFTEKLEKRLKERLDNAKGLFGKFKGTEAGDTYAGEAVGYDKAITVIKFLAAEYGVEVE